MVMKFLFAGFPNPDHTTQGLFGAIKAMGHETMFWEPNIPILEIVPRNQPDVLVITAANINSALIKAHKRFPKMKIVVRVDNFEEFDTLSPIDKSVLYIYRPLIHSGKTNITDHWLSLPPAADTNRFVPTEPKEFARSQISYIGPATKLTRQYLNSLCSPVGKFNIKLFTDELDQSTLNPQDMGIVKDNEIPTIIASSMICPIISESPSMSNGVLSVFDVIYCGGLCVTNFPTVMTNKLLPCFSDNLEKKVNEIFCDYEKYEAIKKKAKEEVMRKHTYAHRAHQLIKELER
jgi:hypothetical protein